MLDAASSWARFFSPGPSLLEPPPPARTRFSPRGWKFIKDDAGLTAAPDSWQSVTIPHTWNTKSDDAGDHKSDPHFKPGYYRGACWYAKSLDIPADWAGQTRLHPFRGRVPGLQDVPQRPTPGGTSGRLHRVLLRADPFGSTLEPGTSCASRSIIRRKRTWRRSVAISMSMAAFIVPCICL